MKSSFIYIGLLLAICASVYFVYQRSFVYHNFEVVNSEEVTLDDSSTEAVDGTDQTPHETQK